MEKSETIKKNVAERILKQFSVIAFIFGIILIIILKWNNKDFPLLGIILLIFSSVAIFSATFFFFSITRYFSSKKEEKKTDDSLPPAITLGQAKEIIKNILTNPEYADHVCGWERHKIYHVGKMKKSQVLEVQLERTPYHASNQMYIIMNMHYPNTMITILTDPTSYELHEARNSLAVDPEDDPVIEQTESHNELTGTTIKKTVKGPKSKEKKEEKEKEGKLE